MKKGTRVRFTVDGLGASKFNELHHFATGDVYNRGDEGVVAFRHPNKKNCPDWFYVEVPSKEEPGALRYVGVSAAYVEVVK